MKVIFTTTKIHFLVLIMSLLAIIIFSAGCNQTAASNSSSKPQFAEKLLGIDKTVQGYISELDSLSSSSKKHTNNEVLSSLSKIDSGLKECRKQVDKLDTNQDTKPIDEAYLKYLDKYIDGVKQLVMSIDSADKAYKNNDKSFVDKSIDLAISSGRTRSEAENNLNQIRSSLEKMKQ